MIVPEQIRAARALLDWSQSMLATKAGVHVASVKSVESGVNVRASTLRTIETALSGAGIVFLDQSDVSGIGLWRRRSPQQGI